MTGEKKVVVTGHRNPDTDAICSAIAYAYFKNQLTGSDRYEPRRIGDVNGETACVLCTFGHEAPEYLEDVRLQVSDLPIEKGEVVSRDLSIRRAWEILRKEHLSTLAVARKNGSLEGLITIGDIAKSIMGVQDSRVLADAKTPYSNIIETLEARLLTGEIEGRTATGKVLIAAANPDLMENYIEPGDMIIVGDRYETQLCAVEMQAGCLIICMGNEADEKILRMAQESGCIVLSSPYDTFITARLLNESIPIEYFMLRDNIISFTMSDYVDNIRGTMANVRHRSFPVLDSKHRYLGMVTRQNLLKAEKKRVILVDHNEAAQSVEGLQEAEIEEIVDHHKLGMVETMRPIMFRNQPVGCTSTIIYMMFREKKMEIPADIAGLMCSAIISDTLLFRSPTCTAADRRAVQELAKIAGIDPEEHARTMFRAGSDFSSKTEREILYQDFKRFKAGETVFGVGQITSMDGEELAEMADRMAGFMADELTEGGMDMIFLMMTDILKESTLLVCVDDAALRKVREYHDYPQQGDHALLLENVVSRKKQILPLLMTALS